MNYILMNQNTPVLSLELQEGKFTRLLAIFDIRYAPLALYNAYQQKSMNLLKACNQWFQARAIPSWRKDLTLLLEKLAISSTSEILLAAHGLSLADQYWFLKEGENLTWQDIEFFTHEFEYQQFLQASMAPEQAPIKEEKYSPNQTTDGMLPKSWFIDEKYRRLLIKGTYEFSNQEPINEYLATQIAKRLTMSHCPYEVRTWQGKLVSVCENFLKGNQEIITANDIYDLRKKKNHVSDYEHYLEILAAHGLADARNELENMLVLDFLMMNHDRHMKNFGIIRNVKTLEWEKVAPIYDTGQAMNCDKLTKEMNFFEGCGKLFFNTKKKFSTYPKLIHDWSRFDFEKLADLPEEYEAILRQYQVYTQMPDSRIEKQVAGLKWRIANLKSYSQ